MLHLSDALVAPRADGDDLTTPVVDRSALSSADVDGTSQQLDVGLYPNEPPITSFTADFDHVELDHP